MLTLINVGKGSFTPELADFIERFTKNVNARPAVAALESGSAPALPAPAEARTGEHYAGIVLDESGKPAHHLFLLDVRPEKKLTWSSAKEWAESVEASLPTRFEAALLYANLRGQFDTSAWHWTDTQYSDDSAWAQYFSSGNQNFYAKTGKLLARAVRRLPL